MKLTVGRVLAAGVALLFVAALGYLTRGPIQSATVIGASGAVASRATATGSTAVSLSDLGSGTAPSAGTVTAVPSSRQPKTVNIGLRKRRHHEGHEGHRGGERDG